MGWTTIKIIKQVNPVVKATESYEFIIKCKQSVNKSWNHSWGWNILHNFQSASSYHTFYLIEIKQSSGGVLKKR